MSTTEPDRTPRLSLEVSDAARRYVRAHAAYHEASVAFDQACRAARKRLEPGVAYLIRADFVSWLVILDEQGDLRCERLMELH